MTPVEELFEKLWNTDKDKLTWNAILKTMLEKEAFQMCEAYIEGYYDGRKSNTENYIFKGWQQIDYT